MNNPAQMLCNRTRSFCNSLIRVIEKCVDTCRWRRSPILHVFLCSALLYLNGDFKGGEFLFANPDDSIQVWFNVLSNNWEKLHRASIWPCQWTNKCMHARRNEKRNGRTDKWTLIRQTYRSDVSRIAATVKVMKIWNFSTRLLFHKIYHVIKFDGHWTIPR